MVKYLILHCRSIQCWCKVKGNQLNLNWHPDHRIFDLFTDNTKEDCSLLTVNPKEPEVIMIVNDGSTPFQLNRYTRRQRLRLSLKKNEGRPKVYIFKVLHIRY